MHLGCYNTQNHTSKIVVMLRVFWVVLRLIYVPDVWFSVPWDGQDRPKRQDEYRCDFRPAPHDLIDLELCKGKCGCQGYFGLFLGSDGRPQGPKCVVKGH